MPSSNNVRSREVSGDDDSVSLNSTLPSEPRETYPLEAILAERVSNGVKEYLVKWEGYPDYRCTWETRSNFQDDSTLPEWKQQRIRVKERKAKPFDVQALESRVEEWIAETQRRKARRRAKKVRLGLSVAPLDYGEGHGTQVGQQDDSSSNEEVEGRLPVDKPRSSRTSAERQEEYPKSRKPVSKNEEKLVRSRRRLVRKSAVTARSNRPEYHADSDGDVPMENLPGEDSTIIESLSSEDSLMNDLRKKRINDAAHKDIELPRKSKRADNESRKTKIAHAANIVPQIKNGRDLPVVASSLKETATSTRPELAPAAKPVARPLGPAGKGPARLGNVSKTASSISKPRVTGAAILGNWAKDKRMRKPMSLEHGTIQPGTEKPSNWKTLSTQRRYQKAGRTELPPDPEKLTFVNLKDGKATHKPTGILIPKIAKTPFQMIQEKLSKTITSAEDAPQDVVMSNLTEDDGLFLDMDVVMDSPQTLETNWSSTMASPSGIGQGYQEAIRASNEMSHHTSGQPGLDKEFPQAGSVTSSTVPQLLAFDSLEEPGANRTRPAPIRSHSIPPPPPSEAMPPPPNEPPPPSVEMQLNPENNVQTPTRSLFMATSPKGIAITAQIQSSHARATPAPPASVSPWSERREPSQLDYTPRPAFSLSHVADSPSTSSDLMQRFRLPDLLGDVDYRYASTDDDSVFRTRSTDVIGTIVIGPEYSRVCDDEQMYYGAGHIRNWPDKQTVISSLVETLKMSNSGGLFFSKYYSVLVYPSGVNAWKFMDARFVPNSPQAPLRFVMFTPTVELIPNPTQPLPSNHVSLIMDGESRANALFRQCFGISFANLLPQGNSQNSTKDNFYVMYPLELELEITVIHCWLEANRATVWSSTEVGEWDQFVSTIEAGVVLIHEDITRIHLIPSLARLLRKPVNFFSINLRPAATPDSPVPKANLTRLFPYGAAILLTDSLFLNHPQDAARILHWFRVNILASKPEGTWKIVTRPRLRDWILSIIEERPKSEGKVYVPIYEQIWRMLPLELMDETDDFEFPKEEAPLVCSRGMDGHNLRVGLGDLQNDTAEIAANDDCLADWFAGWGRTKVEVCRKFHIVHGIKDRGEAVRKGWMKRWSYVWAMSPEEFFKCHGIKEWEAAEKKRTEERQKRQEKRRASVKEDEPDVAEVRKLVHERKEEAVKRKAAEEAEEEPERRQRMQEKMRLLELDQEEEKR
ncbi:hypothetical protein MMC13_003632 [Lambiella insularis]|nr:hypothetical protein [Lambiella insularis]